MSDNRKIGRPPGSINVPPDLEDMRQAYLHATDGYVLTQKQKIWREMFLNDPKGFVLLKNQVEDRYTARKKQAKDDNYAQAEKGTEKEEEVVGPDVGTERVLELLAEEWEVVKHAKVGQPAN